MRFFAALRHSIAKGSKRAKLGRYGEDLAASALVGKGYRIIKRNARIYRREVDIIAMDGEALVFIEVKSRSDHSFGRPEEAIGSKSRKRLREAARIYAVNAKLDGAPIRFDVVAVDFTGGPKPRVELIKNAF